MTVGSLFAGIGGFELAAQWAGFTPVWSNEIDPFCCKVLRKNFKHKIIEDDIRNIGAQNLPPIDILTGGPPCQPASQAGKRKGEKDNRWLWPEAIRVFGEIRPRIAVFENPDDLLTLDNGQPFERICRAMEDFGYKVETFGIPAACVGAWHERDRIWIIAYADNFSNPGELDNRTVASQAKGDKRSHYCERKALDRQWIRVKFNTEITAVSDTNPQGLQESTRTKFRGFFKTSFTPQGCESGGGNAAPGTYWQAEPGVVRMVHGLPNRVDRIKSLGNSIVPQVALQIFNALKTL